MCCAGPRGELGGGCDQLRRDRRCGSHPGDRGNRPPRLASCPGAGDAPWSAPCNVAANTRRRNASCMAQMSKACTAGSRIMLSDFRAPISVLWLRRTHDVMPAKLLLNDTTQGAHCASTLCR